MKPKLFLRIASGLMLFHLVGHTIGHLSWKQDTDPERLEVIKQMTGHQFPFMGAMRSMGDYYDGYGWAVCITLLFFAIILWLASGALKENNTFASKIIMVTIISLFAWSIIEFIFFFPFAACISLFAALLSLIALMQLKKQDQ